MTVNTDFLLVKHISLSHGYLSLRYVARGGESATPFSLARLGYTLIISNFHKAILIASAILSPIPCIAANVGSLRKKA
jgi:hypothetical protein